MWCMDKLKLGRSIREISSDILYNGYQELIDLLVHFAFHHLAPKRLDSLIIGRASDHDSLFNSIVITVTIYYSHRQEYQLQLLQ